MKVEFLTTLDVRFHDGMRWQLTAPFVAVVTDEVKDGLHFDAGGEQRIIRVPDGYLTDFCSVPRLPLVYMQFANKAHRPAVLHDWLYNQGGDQAARNYADQVFLQGMLGTGMSEQDAYSMFEAVHKFGESHFNWH